MRRWIHNDTGSLLSECPDMGYEVEVVDAKDFDAVVSENDQLRQKVDDLTAATVHSCGPTCGRPACVQRRKIEELEAERDMLRRQVILLADELMHHACKVFKTEDYTANSWLSWAADQARKETVTGTGEEK